MHRSLKSRLGFEAVSQVNLSTKNIEDFLSICRSNGGMTLSGGATTVDPMTVDRSTVDRTALDRNDS